MDRTPYRDLLGEARDAILDAATGEHAEARRGLAERLDAACKGAHGPLEQAQPPFNLDDPEYWRATMHKHGEDYFRFYDAVVQAAGGKCSAVKGLERLKTARDSAHEAIRQARALLSRLPHIDGDCARCALDKVLSRAVDEPAPAAPLLSNAELTDPYEQTLAALAAGALTEGQAAHRLHIDRITVRALADYRAQRDEDAHEAATDWRAVAQAFRDATSPEAEAARREDFDPYLEAAQESYNLAVAKHPAPPCRRCTECTGQAHHWMQECPEGATLPVWACKHCPAQMPYDPTTESGMPPPSLREAS